MTWNYRVFRHNDPDGGYSFAIHEAFYEDIADTIPTSWTVRAVGACGEQPNELLDVLAKMAVAVDKPVLREVDGKAVEVE